MESERTAYWWLLLLTFAPVVFIFAISQFLPQALWVDRYFIFVAPSYFILVAMAANRLRPRLLRTIALPAILAWGLVAGYADFSSNRMAWESPQVGSRVPWEMFASKLTDSEAVGTDRIRIYTLTVMSKGFSTGDWALGTSLLYHLNTLQDNRFVPVYARDTFALLESLAVEQDSPEHFWVGYIDLGASGNSPQAILAGEGYRVGETELFSDGQNSVQLFPVWHE